jgi:predicted AAA+ superfamily ATPase
MRKRFISEKIKDYAQKFPIITITGPRQSGKTTLCKHLFADKPYISLEDLDERQFATEDPKGFLAQFPEGAILDEIQRVPELLSYIQTVSDAQNKEGLFILTGSQQFELLSHINQSLAGRTAIVKLLPFSLREAYDDTQDLSLDQVLFTGFYPRIFDKKISPTDWLTFYTSTYIERDIRQLIQIQDLSKFETFIKLCGGRTGQLVNMSNMANDCDVTHNTVKSWLSLLEASYIITLLKPYHANINKRLVKSPKLYFLDTGLAAYLMGINDATQLQTHPLKGALFETFVVAEQIKQRFNKGVLTPFYFYRDHTGNEIDMIAENGLSLELTEIKLAQTIKPDFFKGFGHFPVTKSQNRRVIYGGNLSRRQQETEIVGWRGM